MNEINVDLTKWMKNNKIKTLPKKQIIKRKLFEYILNKEFEKNKIYSEKEVNIILQKYYDDYVILRRYMIDFELLSRKDDCTKYWVKINN